MALSRTTVDVRGRCTEVLVTGRGEPLVYQHGGGIMEGFDFLERLAGRFEVFAPLMPGYGETDPEPPVDGRDAVAEHLADVLDALGLDRTVLVGHSLGAWSAAAVAARYPARVSELVLGSPLGMRVPNHPVANMMALSFAERLDTLSVEPAVWAGRLPSGPDPKFQAARERELASMKHFAPGPFDPDLAAVTARLTTPTLLLWGEVDRLIPVVHAQHWQAAIPHASLRTFPGGGHLLFAERPDALDAVTAFVDSCRA